MNIRKRRRWMTVLLVLFALVIGGIAIGAAFLGRPEKVDRLWAVATLDANGNARITESIDYDFANNDKHGIFRTIPELSTDAIVEVSSLSAPAGTERTDVNGQSKIRIGDPAITVSGQHRYRLTYSLDTLTDGNAVAWDAAGTDWSVGMDAVEAHVVAPYELINLRCVQGKIGSERPCDIEQVEPGHIVARVGSQGSHEGVSIFADRGAPLVNAPVTPIAPFDQPERDGTNPFVVGLIALITVFAGMVIGRQLTLRVGRERVGAGGAADAAWAMQPERIDRIDAARLAELATIEFAPPEGLSPSRGGVLISEAVTNDHKAAWLMQASIDEFMTIEGQGKKKLVMRRNAEKHGYADVILNQAFRNRDSISLGKYDKSFSDAWSSIGRELEGWRKSCGLWDPAGDRRLNHVLVFGSLLAAVAGVIAFGSSAFAGGGSSTWMVPAGFAFVALGAAIAALTFSSELRVRTPQGSGLWLRTESFRRFLAQSEAKHVEFAAQHNMLREYTAWAVALGEVDRWTSAMGNAALTPEQRDDSGFYASAPYFAAAAVTASTEPPSSNSSSGSFGGGSVGGGGGGGGGGSW
jgi:hypothetical protein